MFGNYISFYIINNIKKAGCFFNNIIIRFEFLNVPLLKSIFYIIFPPYFYLIYDIHNSCFLLPLLFIIIGDIY